jgi:hypothetical protein
MLPLRCTYYSIAPERPVQKRLGRDEREFINSDALLRRGQQRRHRGSRMLGRAENASSHEGEVNEGELAGGSGSGGCETRAR